MNQGSSLLFDGVAAVFLLLTLLVAIVVFSVASDAIEPPFLAPEEEDPLPTEYVPLTLTPSPAPGMDMTPSVTPEPDPQ